MRGFELCLANGPEGNEGSVELWTGWHLRLQCTVVESIYDSISYRFKRSVFAALIGPFCCCGEFSIDPRRAILSMALWLTTSWSFFLQPNIFINEIHYFNNSTGQAEFVELAYESGQDVSQVYLQLYIGTDGQGATGQMYGERLFVGTDGIPGSVGAFGGLSFVCFDIDGLRNSASGDGMALVDGRSGVVIEFISYDGQFVATQGPANGMESVDIGVSELIDGEVGLSLQLGGVGCVRSGFVWQTVQTATKGELNYGQAGTCASNAPSSSPSMTPSLIASSAPSLLPSSAPSVVVVSSVPICEAQYGR